MVDVSNFKKAFLDERSADIFFIFKTVANETTVGEENQNLPVNEATFEKVPAHKIILSVASKVFHQTFSESSTLQDSIEIADAPKNAFIEFLQFFYLVKPAVSFECAGDVLYLAEKYNVSHCTREVFTLLETWINPEQVANIYELAKRHNIRNVEKRCNDFLISNVNDILLSDTFSTCSVRCLKLIVEFWSFWPPLQFKACLDWSHRKCVSDKKDPSDMKHRRMAIGDAFEVINFGQMQQQDLLDCFILYGDLFTFEEMRQLAIDILRKNLT